MLSLDSQSLRRPLPVDDTRRRLSAPGTLGGKAAAAPAESPRFRGDFVLDSQGDKEQIYLPPSGPLAVLELSQSIDDTAWATAARGSLYIADNADSIVDVLRGGFKPGTAFVAVTPCDADDAPATCPAPGFPPDYLGTLDMQTGQIRPADIGKLHVQPHGLTFVAG